MTEIGSTFGNRQVNVDDKQPLVDDVFTKVAGRYDIMNDLMSGFIHRLWKDAMVAKLKPRKKGPVFRCIDVAGGTGDIAFRIIEAARGNAKVDVVDINPSMLAVGEERANQKGLSGKANFIEGNAEALDQTSDTYDAYTIAFGIRNVPRIDAALSEAHRVLKFGGTFACLEFSTVDLPGFDRAYEAYSDAVIPRLGAVVGGDEESYRYLVESIRKFPNRARFAKMIERAGFRRVQTTVYSGGIAVLHTALKA